MTEKLRKESEGSRRRELVPDPLVIDALRGKISEPTKTISYKSGSAGEEVEVRLALEGPCHFGLEDWKDNKEWSGIFNHVLLSARYSTYFAQKLQEKGLNVNPQRILNAMIVSHPGRRQWDEAGWYPEAVDKFLGEGEAARRKSMSNETLGLHLINRRVSQETFDLVAGLAHNLTDFEINPDIHESLDYRIAIYTDHRTTQSYQPLNERMGDFLLGNFFPRNVVNENLKERVYKVVDQIITNKKNGSLVENEEHYLISQLGANQNSDRLSLTDLTKLIVQDAATEAQLLKNDIDPDNINDETVPMPQWEKDLRLQYVKSASKEIKAELKYYNEWIDFISFKQEDPELPEVIRMRDEAFPEDTWWGGIARSLVNKRKSPWV